MSIKNFFLIQEIHNYTTRLSRSGYRASSYYIRSYLVAGGDLSTGVLVADIEHDTALG